MDLDKLDNMKKLLDQNYTWPTSYMFKFIVKPEYLNELLQLIGEAKIIKRESKKGKYLSVTATKKVNSSDEVLAIYKKVSTIEGIVSL